jgi:hypothetical protein
MNQPPRLATALLCHLTERNETALGDLVEQFQGGKSALWYWRQIIGVVVHSAWDDLRRKPALMLAAMIGAAIVTSIAPLVIGMLISLDEQLFVRGFRWFYSNGYRLHPIHPYWIVSSFYALVGWGVGRIARRRQAAVVLAFACSLFVCGVLFVCGLVSLRVDLTNLSYDIAFHALSRDAPIFRFPGVVVFNVVVLSLITVVAGLSAGLRSSNRRGVIT